MRESTANAKGIHWLYLLNGCVVSDCAAQTCHMNPTALSTTWREEERPSLALRVSVCASEICASLWHNHKGSEFCLHSFCLPCFSLSLLLTNALVSRRWRDEYVQWSISSDKRMLWFCFLNTKYSYKVYFITHMFYTHTQCMSVYACVYVTYTNTSDSWFETFF